MEWILPLIFISGWKANYQSQRVEVIAAKIIRGLKLRKGINNYRSSKNYKKYLMLFISDCSFQLFSRQL